jgi:general secretion pathway protein K
VNVNTATAPVLQAVVDELGPEGAAALRESAAEEPFDSLQAFLEHPLVRDADVEQSGLAVRSRHFRVRVDVELGRLRYTLYSWLQRGDNGASTVLRRARTPS